MSTANHGALRLADDVRTRIGQTLVTGFTGVEATAARELLDSVRPAGVILMPRNIQSAAQVSDLVEGLQASARELGLPALLIAIDQEGGAVARLGADAGFSEYPSAMALGTGGDVHLAHDLAVAVGRELATVGINVAFAPVLDLAVDPGNRVIGSRSYGADPELVASFGCAVIDGLRKAGVLACAKHYPGHGATASDSHLELPRLTASLAETRDRDLVPFRAAIAAGCAAIMTGHLISALDPNHPVTVSEPALRVLREELRFDGLVITDALEMQALTALDLPPGRPGAEALRAGADLLLFDGDRELLDVTIAEIVRSIRRGDMDPGSLETRAGRLADVRAWIAAVGPPQMPVMRTERATEAAEQAAQIGLAVSDPDGILPLLVPPLVVDVDRGRDLAEALGWPLVTVDVAAASGHHTCVIAVTDNELDDATQVAASLLTGGGGETVAIVLEGWQPPPLNTSATVLAFDLPHTRWAAIGNRLLASPPPVAGYVDSAFAAVVDTRLVPDIVPRIAPCAQLAVRRDGRRVIDVAVGDSLDGHDDPVTVETRFDLASITKVVTALAFLRLVEEDVVALDGSVHDVLPTAFAGEASTRRITWRHLLAHASGLPASVDLTMTDDKAGAMARVLATAPGTPPGEHVVYSDVGFMLVGLAIEALTHASLDVAVGRLVLTPLGLTRTSFRTESWVSIAQTEVCRWRRRRLRGEVHDENAAALGGVAGHAGLFGTAQDVVELGRCLLDGGRPLLRRETIAEMLRVQARDGDVRRGLGVSLWSPGPDTTGNPFGTRSFGHTGFTGTSLWVDPERRLVTALLTNTVSRRRDDSRFWAARIALHRAIVEISDAQPTGLKFDEGDT